MTDLVPEYFVQLGYALGIGILIGLERSVAVAVPRVGGDPPAPVEIEPTAETMGLRTFAILSLLGYGAALAGERFAPLAAVALLGAAALVVASYFRSPPDARGITTEVAAVATCLLGYLCRYQPGEAGILALVFTVMLASKRFTWDTIRRMRRVELTDTIKFLVVILIVLPLLPKEALDPWNAFNPRKVGMLVVLISGVSFVGYFLTRILGTRRGIGLTGILGGMTSSTAVTAAMASDARGEPALTTICAFSAVAANATMFVRVLVVVFLIDLPLGRVLALPLGTMAVLAAVAAGVLWVRSNRDQAAGESRVKLQNPFSLGPAIKFAAFFVFILFLVRMAREWWGDQGLFIAAALSGLADVDAITLSISEQAHGGTLPLEVGALGITIAVVSNGVVKTGIAFGSGTRRFGLTVGACLLLATLGGLGVALVA